MEKVHCFVSGKEISIGDAASADLLREPIYRLILKDHPDIRKTDFISKEELNAYRKKYLETLITDEIGELDVLEKEVVDAIQNNKILSENIEPDIEEQLSIGQKLADKIAEFGGSWTFIIVFFSFLFLWMIVNILILRNHSWDPYPFILLNLILSCIAAIQAPIIMMSQNRQEQKDRIRSEHDYKVNLKAELEIKLLHEKLDHLMIHQNRRLLEIQEIQTDFLEDILKQVKPDQNKGN
jgi:uncharacterized membrane protein